ncbi:E3 ubiquitin-protein ligase TRIM33-like [Acyrthosiphon pisum]|uniref:Uncharacterized protein n=1 Tax=Acyrthosiphon pisum TaxID=7029 RepID=A0A8R2D3F3_ACYPI|nr:E3 ubiquitin-protein ligase TRIM33-like [Acyrthosiphon pisum]|eukprot:XP_016659627.1 PREDICTED: E3 ubiquitin-protein ligase TRIM33-like [Acyrthosiphon pisum]
MKTFRMNYEKSDSSSSDDDDLDRQGYRKCSGCTDWDHQLIYCSACKRSYHKNCHLPPLPNTMSYTDLASYESWICTMCVNIDDISKIISKTTSDSIEKCLNKNEIIMASRILLELIGDEKNSFQFMELPFKYSDPHYYRVVYRPVSLNTVKERLSSESNGYTSLSEVIFDIKRIYSNSLFYYHVSDPYYAMAQKQEKLLFEMLNKWIPQYQHCHSSTVLPNVKSEQV